MQIKWIPIDFFRTKKTTIDVTRGCFKGYQKQYKAIGLTMLLTRALRRPEVAKGFTTAEVSTLTGANLAQLGTE